MAGALDQLHLAEIALSEERLGDAIALLRTAARLDREAARPRFMLAYALSRNGQRQEAITVLRRLIESYPANAEAWFNLGNLLRAERRLVEAASVFKRAAELRPDRPDPEINLSYVLVQLGKFGEAERQVRRSLQRFPQEPDLLVNLAQIHRALGRWDDAVATLDRCVALAPGNAGYRITRSLALQDAGQADRALDDLASLLKDQPQNAEARFVRAQIYLSRSEYRLGWADYLWRPDRIRWLSGHHLQADVPPPAQDELRGRRVTLCGEQGLGDTLFFLRFAPLLEQTAKAVTLDVDARLHAVLPAKWMPAAPDRDVQILVGDLPEILGVGPIRSLRLECAPARAAHFHDRLSRCGPPPYIGVTWQGGFRWEDMATPGEKLSKRVPPAALGAALRTVPGTLISLQRHAPSEDLAAMSDSARRQVHDLSSVNEDLADALALLANLDEYIAVSNTNVHLNDALGKSTRVLVTHPAEWRWTAAADVSPWFPDARLYRQGRDGSWDAALGRLRSELE